MIKIRPAESIYHKAGGWFDARWHFSFDDYYDDEYMGFGTMRVFNDDRLVPGAVWPLHPHRNIEGLTYVAEGTFRHEDSLGNGGVLPAGSAQRMTLGSGAYHSEQNGSETEPMRFIQVWIMPAEQDLPPSVEQKIFTEADRRNRLLRIIGPKGADGAVLVHNDASMYVSSLDGGESLAHRFDDGFGGYLYVLNGGPLTVGGNRLYNGDAAMIAEEPELTIEAEQDTHLVMVEVQVA